METLSAVIPWPQDGLDVICVRNRAVKFEEKYQVIKSAMRYMQQEGKFHCIAANRVITGLRELNGVSRAKPDPRDGRRKILDSRPLFVAHQAQDEKGIWVEIPELSVKWQNAKTRTVIVINEWYYEEKRNK